MEGFLAGVMAAARHSDEAKVALVRAVLKSNKLACVTPQDAAAWCGAALRLLEAEPSKLRRQLCTLVLERAVQIRGADVKEELSVERLRSWFPPSLSAERGVASVAVRKYRAALHALAACCTIGELEQRVAPIRALCTLALIGEAQQQVPAPDTQLELLFLWRDMPAAAPEDARLRAVTLVQWLAEAQEVGSVPNPVAAPLVAEITARWPGGTLARTTGDARPEELTGALLTVFNLLAGIGAVRCTREPSSALRHLVERFPLELVSDARRFVEQAAKSGLGEPQLELAVVRMVRWPASSALAAWISALLDGFCSAQRFRLLNRIAGRCLPALLLRLAPPPASAAAQSAESAAPPAPLVATAAGPTVSLVRKLLLGHQSSPQLFHALLPQLTDAVTRLVASGQRVEAAALAEAMYMLFYHFTGYPDRYTIPQAKLSEAGFSSPSESEMRTALARSTWSAVAGADIGRGDDEEWAAQTGGRGPTGKAGLVNLGNTCYINAVLQSLFVTDEFRYATLGLDATRMSSALLESVFGSFRPSGVAAELQRVFASLMLSRRRSVRPVGLRSQLPREFGSVRQQDATEFAKFVLEALGPALVAAPVASLVHSVQAEADNGASDSKRARVDESEAATLLRRFGVDPYFGGLLESVITCAECGLRSATVEPFSFLTLAVPEGKDGERRQLGELLDSFTRPERLVGANSYLCARCNAKREAEKALCVRTPPRCLFICLKRNIYEAGTRERHKIMTQVQFPCLLRLGSAPYVLYSAVIHSGSSAQYGHYYCVARHSTDALRAAQLALSSSLDAGDAERTAAGDAAASPTWMLYNDEAVSASSFQSLADISRAFAHDVPYALLYRRAAPEDLCALPALTALAAASVPRTIAAEITADNQRLAEEQERHARAQPFGAAGMDSQNDGTPTYYDPDAGDFDASDARRAGGSGPGFQHGPSRHWGE